MIVKDLDKEKLTARCVETSSWENIRLRLKSVTGRSYRGDFALMRAMSSSSSTKLSRKSFHSSVERRAWASICFSSSMPSSFQGDDCLVRY